MVTKIRREEEEEYSSSSSSHEDTTKIDVAGPGQASSVCGVTPSPKNAGEATCPAAMVDGDD